MSKKIKPEQPTMSDDEFMNLLKGVDLNIYDENRDYFDVATLYDDPYENDYPDDMGIVQNPEMDRRNIPKDYRPMTERKKKEEKKAKKERNTNPPIPTIISRKKEEERKAQAAKEKAAEEERTEKLVDRVVSGIMKANEEPEEDIITEEDESKIFDTSDVNLDITNEDGYEDPNEPELTGRDDALSMLLSMDDPFATYETEEVGSELPSEEETPDTNDVFDEYESEEAKVLAKYTGRMSHLQTQRNVWYLEMKYYEPIGRFVIDDVFSPSSYSNECVYNQCIAAEDDDLYALGVDVPDGEEYSNDLLPDKDWMMDLIMTITTFIYMHKHPGAVFEKEEFMENFSDITKLDPDILLIDYPTDPEAIGVYYITKESRHALSDFVGSVAKRLVANTGFMADYREKISDEMLQYYATLSPLIAMAYSLLSGNNSFFPNGEYLDQLLSEENYMSKPMMDTLITDAPGTTFADPGTATLSREALEEVLSLVDFDATNILGINLMAYWQGDDEEEEDDEDTIWNQAQQYADDDFNYASILEELTAAENEEDEEDDVNRLLDEQPIDESEIESEEESEDEPVKEDEEVANDTSMLDPIYEEYVNQAREANMEVVSKEVFLRDFVAGKRYDNVVVDESANKEDDNQPGLDSNEEPAKEESISQIVKKNNEKELHIGVSEPDENRESSNGVGVNTMAEALSKAGVEDKIGSVKVIHKNRTTH